MWNLIKYFILKEPSCLFKCNFSTNKLYNVVEKIIAAFFTFNHNSIILIKSFL